MSRSEHPSSTLAPIVEMRPADPIPSLFDIPAIPAAVPAYDRTRMDEARKAAEPRIAEAEAHADPDFLTKALDAIREIPSGNDFLMQDVVRWLAERDITTHDKRAAGAVAVRARREGLVKRAGFATDDFGSPKTLWTRL